MTNITQKKPKKQEKYTSTTETPQEPKHLSTHKHTTHQNITDTTPQRDKHHTA